jgi:hypothetical protein
MAIGIGINTRGAFLANKCSPEGMEFTTIWDMINVAPDFWGLPVQIRSL